MGGEATVKAQLLVPTSRYLEFKVCYPAPTVAPVAATVPGVRYPPN